MINDLVKLVDKTNKKEPVVVEAPPAEPVVDNRAPIMKKIFPNPVPEQKK